MFTIYAVVEGQTEERFVQDLLNPQFFHPALAHLEPILLGLSSSRAMRGGKVNADRVYTHLRRLVAQHGHRLDVGFTTLLDLYRLPPDFPGNDTSLPSLVRAKGIEQQLSTAIPHPRFVPYIQLHEFEALLFSDPAAFQAAFPGTTEQSQQLSDIAATFASPEEINGGELTSPAQRISRVYPQFEKVAHGPQIAMQIGLPRIRRSCPHFASWLNRLAALLAPAG